MLNRFNPIQFQFDLIQFKKNDVNKAIFYLRKLKTLNFDKFLISKTCFKPVKRFKELF